MALECLLRRSFDVVKLWPDGGTNCRGSSQIRQDVLWEEESTSYWAPQAVQIRSSSDVTKGADGMVERVVLLLFEVRSIVTSALLICRLSYVRALRIRTKVRCSNERFPGMSRVIREGNCEDGEDGKVVSSVCSTRSLMSYPPNCDILSSVLGIHARIILSLLQSLLGSRSRT